MIDAVYKNELPVVYDPPKPKKVLFTEDDLYKADTFGFGSIIGSITNKSSIAYSMLPLIEEEFGKESEEYKLTVSRLQQCCAAQSRQIDKTKIGQVVKGIPKVWIEKQDDPFYNSILLNKYPYFFKYRYKKARDDYKKYIEECGSECKYKFRIPLDTLLRQEEFTDDQVQFLHNFYKYMPLVYSDSPMNLLCRHIEEKHFDILKRIQTQNQFDHRVLYHPDYSFTEEEYHAVVTIFKEFKSIAKAMSIQKETYGTDNNVDFFDYHKYRIGCDACMQDLIESLGNVYLIANCLVKYFYEEMPKSNKELLWALVGQQLYEAIKRNLHTTSVMFPFPDPDGDIAYLNSRYTMKEVEIH